MKYDIVTLYICIDDFSKIYEEWEQKKLIGATKNRKREGKLSISEKLLIVVLYHLEGFKNFKYYYKYVVEIKYKSLFKEVLWYDRFIQIMPNLLLPLSRLLQFLFGEARGIYFLDTTATHALFCAITSKISIDLELNKIKKFKDIIILFNLNYG